MGSDLISRKRLIENLNKFAPEHYSALINDLIMQEPTAFDKEKAIALNNSIIDDVQDVKTLRKELAMWQEYKEVVHKKSLEKDSTEHAAKEFIYSEKSVNDIIGKLQHKINSCIDFIGQIEDSVVRQACFYKWIEGKTWIQVGFKMNMTDEAIRIRVNRYLRKVKRN